MKRKTIIIGSVALLTCLLAVWAWTRWDAWFHNPEEQPYVPSKSPAHVLLTFGDKDGQTRNVSWQCDTVVRPSCVELVCLADSDTLRVEAVGEVFRSRSGQAAYYRARLPLPPLSPAPPVRPAVLPQGNYAYRVITGGNASPWYQFRTYPDNRQRMSFLYVGDVQDTLGGQANRLLREALSRHPESEFLVCGGDLTERPTHQYWEEAFRDVDSVAQAMPLLAVTGNHDYLKGVIMRLERRFPLVFSYFLDSKVADNQVYTLCYGPVQFFLLDSNRELPYLHTQRQWLKQQLEQSDSRWKIVVLHHPLFSIRNSNNNLIQRWMFNDLIEDYGVDLVLQGHEHAYARMTRHDDTGQPVTPVYTVSHCSPKNYRIEFDDRFDKFGISSRYYQTVSISGDTLTLTAYDANRHTTYDSLLIVKATDGPAAVQDYGKDIPEYLDFTPDAHSKKDQSFADRIADYKRRHPERTAP